MKYFRFVTYLVLFAAIFVATRRSKRVIPVQLAPPSYERQTEDLLIGTQTTALWSAEFAVSGGLPPEQQWSRHDGPDFYVWASAYTLVDAKVQVGVYLGGHPQIQPPTSGLELGNIGGIPVLWWKRTDENYRTKWDAIIPKRNGAHLEYVHVWIASLHPQRVQEAAELLREVKFTQ